MAKEKIILTLPDEMMNFLRKRAAPKFLNAQQVIRDIIAEEMIKEAERAENG